MKWKLYLLCFLLGFKALAQIQTSLIKASITMPSTMPANVQDWATTMPPVIIQASATPNADKRIPGEVAYAQVMVTINSADGKKVCGSYMPNTAPEAGISSLVKIYKGADIERLLGQTCTLQPGDYQLCVQFYYIKGEVNRISEQVCKQFSVKGKAEDMKFSGPQLIAPANGKVLTETEQKQPITFRWTPLIPKPKEDVSYKVTVVEIRKGQSASEARIASNSLLETIVKNQTQMLTKGTIASIAPISKDSQYGWYVQAIGQEGNVLGTSEMAMFRATSQCSPDYEMKNLKAECGKDGKVHVTGNIVITPKSTITINQISLMDIKETNFSGAFVPTSILIFPKNLTGVSNIYAFDFIINSAFCNKDLYIGYNINFKCTTTGQTIDLPCAEIVKNIPCCSCTFCDQYKDLEVKTEKLTFDGGFVNLSTSFSSPSIAITTLKAEVISFAHNGKEACIGCNKDPKTFGNISGGTFGTWDNGVNPLTGSITTHHTMSWFGTSGSTTNLSGSDLNISISTPPLSTLDCCDDEIQFCIRYSFTDKECRTCSFVKCYRMKRKNK